MIKFIWSNSFDKINLIEKFWWNGIWFDYLTNVQHGLSFYVSWIKENMLIMTIARKKNRYIILILESSLEHVAHVKGRKTGQSTII